MIKRGAVEEPRCSFCNKSQNQVLKLIAGPSVFICDECVAVCQDMIVERGPWVEAHVVTPTPNRGGERVELAVRCALCGATVPQPDVIPIQDHGVLCLGCAGQVEAAIAKRRQSAE